MASHEFDPGCLCSRCTTGLRLLQEMGEMEIAHCRILLEQLKQAANQEESLFAPLLVRKPGAVN